MCYSRNQELGASVPFSKNSERRSVMKQLNITRRSQNRIRQNRVICQRKTMEAVSGRNSFS